MILHQPVIVELYEKHIYNIFLSDDNMLAAVFKYAPPGPPPSPSHSVYLLPDLRSFLKCDFSKATMVANVTQGGGEGFEFVLEDWKPHYFACGEHNGIHCSQGQMKFIVVPLLRWYR